MAEGAAAGTVRVDTPPYPVYSFPSSPSWGGVERGEMGAVTG